MKRSAFIFAVLILCMVPFVSTSHPVHGQSAPAIAPSAFALPPWAIPATAMQIDSETIPQSCDPHATGVPDVLLLAHESWCDLDVSTGLFEMFSFPSSTSSTTTAAWAATVYPSASAASNVAQLAASEMDSIEVDDYGCDTDVQLCHLYDFTDQSTFDNPDGTVSPGPSSDVWYQIWVRQNVVAEVALRTPDGADSPADGTFETLVGDADIVVQAALQGVTPQPLTPTPTVTVAPTATDTPTQSSTSTSSATPIPTSTPTSSGPLSYSMRSVKIGYGSSITSNMLDNKSLASIRVAQKVKLYAFATFSNIVAPTPIQIAFRVTCNGKTSLYDNESEQLTSGNDSGYMSWWRYFSPSHPGACTFTATVFVHGTHQHKSVAFAVKAAAVAQR
jgi:hypothetical protein